MSKYSIDSTTLTAIGNAIRSKTGGNSPIQVSNFASTIAGLSGGDLSITRLSCSSSKCRYSNQKADYLIYIGDYLPSDLNKVKVILGLVNGSAGSDSGRYSIIWYNNSSNLIQANVREYVNSNGQVITNAGVCPIFINAYGLKIGSSTTYDRESDEYGCLGVIDGQVYTLIKDGNDYIYCNTPDPGYSSSYSTEWIIIKED